MLHYFTTSLLDLYFLFTFLFLAKDTHIYTHRCTHKHLCFQVGALLSLTQYFTIYCFIQFCKLCTFLSNMDTELLHSFFKFFLYRNCHQSSCVIMLMWTVIFMHSSTSYKLSSLNWSYILLMLWGHHSCFSYHTMDNRMLPLLK